MNKSSLSLNPNSQAAPPLRNMSNAPSAKVLVSSQTTANASSAKALVNSAITVSMKKSKKPRRRSRNLSMLVYQAFYRKVGAAIIKQHRYTKALFVMAVKRISLVFVTSALSAMIMTYATNVNRRESIITTFC